MKLFVLILLVSGKAAATAEFSSKEKCEIAGNAAKEAAGWANPTRFVCVEK